MIANNITRSRFYQSSHNVCCVHIRSMEPFYLPNEGGNLRLRTIKRVVKTLISSLDFCQRHYMSVGVFVVKMRKYLPLKHFLRLK